MPETVTCSDEVIPIIASESNGETLADSQYVLRNRDGWEQVLSNRLVEWGRGRLTIDEDDLVPPTESVIGMACELAKHYRDAGELPPPLRVVPDGEGGIAFEWRVGSKGFCSLEITPHEGPILNVFDDCRLVAEIPVEM